MYPCWSCHFHFLELWTRFQTNHFRIIYHHLNDNFSPILRCLAIWYIFLQLNIKPNLFKSSHLWPILTKICYHGLCWIIEYYGNQFFNWGRIVLYILNLFISVIECLFMKANFELINYVFTTKTDTRTKKRLQVIMSRKNNSYQYIAFICEAVFFLYKYEVLWTIGCKFMNSLYILWNCDWIKVRGWQPSCSARAIYQENWTGRTLFEQRVLNELCTSVTKEGVPQSEGWWSRLLSGMRKISQLMLPTQKIYLESASQCINRRWGPNFSKNRKGNI